jgi:hypothetical protein
MSSIRGDVKDAPRRQYIASGVFNQRIFTYSTYLDASKTTRGSLVVAAAANANNCKAGHILRENGKKLLKDVHPDLVDPNNTSVSYSYLVGVYDSNSFVSGFIDPNCPLFAPFNTDKSYSNDILTEAVDAATGLTDEGPPVYTRGDIITTNGNMTATIGNITATAGNIVATAGNITATAGNIAATAGSVTAGTYIAGALQTIIAYNTGLANVVWNNSSTSSCDIFINPTTGNVFTLSIPGLTGGGTFLTGNIIVYCGSGGSGGSLVPVTPPAGAIVSLIITANANVSQPTVQHGTGTRGTNLALTASRIATLTYASNGANLILISTSTNITP